MWAEIFTASDRIIHMIYHWQCPAIQTRKYQDQAGPQAFLIMDGKGIYY